MASDWWDVCNQGTKCLPWNPPAEGGGGYGVSGARSDYGIPLPQGTPITAPVSGIVLPQHPGGAWYSVFGRQSFGGEVDILSNVPEYGGLVNVGVIHMDTASVVPGQVVRKGTVLGTSGGQTSGGNWPSSPQYSSGPHVGVQVHSVFNWGDLKDPSILMQNLWAGKDTSNVPSAGQLSSAKLTEVTKGGPQGGCDFIAWGKCIAGDPVACAACAIKANPALVPAVAGALPPCAPWDIPCLLKQGTPFLVRVMKVAVGVGILFLATLITFLPEVGAGVAVAAGVPEAAPAVSQALGGRRRLPQTRPGAAVQAFSIIQGRGQQRTRERRANVRAQQTGQPVPFPATAEEDRLKQVSQTPTQKLRPIKVPKSAGGQKASRGKKGQGGQGGQGGPSVFDPNAVPANPPPRQPPPGSPVQRGPKTGLSPVPQMVQRSPARGPLTPPPPTAPHTQTMAPSPGGAAPPEPSPEPYRGWGFDQPREGSGRVQPAPQPKQPKGKKGAPIVSPVVPTPTPTPAVPRRRNRAPNPWSPEGREAAKRRRALVPTGPGEPGPLTFEEALQRVRASTRVQPAPLIVATPEVQRAIEKQRIFDEDVAARERSKALKKPEGMSWSEWAAGKK